MKIYNKEDLITWINSEKAVIGNEYYFGDIVEDLNDNIKRNNAYILTDILNGSISHPFVNKGIAYACILPVDAVKEQEKKYKACQTIKEFYEVINNYRTDSFPNEDFTDENFMYNLLDSTIHIRSKFTYTEFYTNIFTITVNMNNHVEISLLLNSYLSFEEIFENYEIELNGKWQPFGVLEN